MKAQSAKLKAKNLAQNSKPELKYRAFNFSISVLQFVEVLPYKRSLRIKIIVDQLIRSATSVGANIVEAQAAVSKRDFLNYFQIALKSANETRYWLAPLKEIEPSFYDKIDELLKETQETPKIIGSSILTMKGKRKL